MEDDFMVKITQKTLTDKSTLFYKLMVSKRPDVDKDSDTEWLFYFIKYYSGRSYFKLMGVYYSFISKITAYYPFSLLYEDRLFHHDNLKNRNFMIRLENIAKKAKLRIFVLNGGISGDISYFEGYLDSTAKNKKRSLDLLETVLQKHFESIFVRSDEAGFKIIIPAEAYKQLVNKI